MLVNEVYEGDCLDVMREFPDNCIDSIITDPPYGLEFMGKDWDYGIPGVAYWREALRIAKPGATLLAFGGSRTYHRLVCAIEDAGWEIRDCISYFHDGTQAERAFMASLSEEQLGAYLELHHPGVGMGWIYGSGFPKSANISKQLDKAAIVDCQYCNGSGKGRPNYMIFCPEHGEIMGDNDLCPVCDSEVEEIELEREPCKYCGGSGKVKGAEREVVGQKWAERYPNGPGGVGFHGGPGEYTQIGRGPEMKTAPATPLAAKFDGYGTALKPAHEPLVCARKPLSPAHEPIVVAMKPIDQSFAANAEKWGVAGLNIDGGRVETDWDTDLTRRGWQGGSTKFRYDQSYREVDGKKPPPNPKGRWPANVIHDGSEEVMAEFDKAGVSVSPSNPVKQGVNSNSHTLRLHEYKSGHYGIGYADSGSAARFFQQCPPDPTAHPEAARFRYCPKAGKRERGQDNNHPTVKPLSLLRYLAKLTRPPDGGIVLDPFGGSGTTALAAIAEGRDYIIIEKESEYVDLCRRRIAEYSGTEIAPVEVKVESDVVKQMSLW